jgi:uncharacterized protein YjbI with pentapeptide repeats
MNKLIKHYFFICIIFTTPLKSANPAHLARVLSGCKEINNFDLSNATLSNLNFKKAVFNNTSLHGCSIINCSFKDAKFNNVDLSNSQLHKVNFRRTKFNNSSFENARGSEISFRRAEIRGVIFAESQLSQTSFYNATIRNCNFDQAITTEYEDENEQENPNLTPQSIQINNPPLHNFIDIIENQTTCPICRENFNKNHTVSVLPCGHIFCQNCIDLWLNQFSSCPLCRESPITHICNVLYDIILEQGLEPDKLNMVEENPFQTLLDLTSDSD